MTGTRRARLLPDVPSWEEAGVTNADVINYWGIVAPAGTPHDVVVRLNGETLRILAQPEVRERLEKEGAELIPGPPEKLAALIETDLNGWKKLIAEANCSSNDGGARAGGCVRRLRRAQRVDDLHPRGACGRQKAADEAHRQRERERQGDDRRSQGEAEGELGEGLEVGRRNRQRLHERCGHEPDRAAQRTRAAAPR